MDNAEIKRTNRKALPRFILLLGVTVIAGGAGDLLEAEENG